ncbi:MAG: DUF433 domain-containing protein, partial [Chloroflexota bacterium]
ATMAQRIARPSQSSKASLYRILTTPTYTIGDASQLVEVSRGRITRWLMGYEYTYEVGEERREGKQASVVTRTDGPQASFLDLMDLLFVQRFLDRGFSLQYLRKALDEARELLGTPHFARSTFFTSGKQLVLQLRSESKYMIALLTGGQGAMSQIIEELDDRIDFEDVTGYGFAHRWYPRGKQGLIVVDPQIAFGRPTVAGRGVTADGIYDLYLGENKRMEPVSTWYRIPPHEVKAAVRFQSSLVGA